VFYVSYRHLIHSKDLRVGHGHQLSKIDCKSKGECLILCRISTACIIYIHKLVLSQGLLIKSNKHLINIYIREKLPDLTV